MKQAVIVSLLMLGGCIPFASHPHGAGVLPDGASAAMWTDRPQADVAACIGRAVGGTPARDAAGRDVVSGGQGGTTYTVGPNSGDTSAYPTMVAIAGAPAGADAQSRLVQCLM